MLKDITIGQYLPGNSPVHRLDPRTKILLIIAFLIVLFTVGNFAGYLALALFLFFVNKTANVPFKMLIKSLKPLLFFIIFTAVINLFLTRGEPIFKWGIITITKEGVSLTISMSLRLIFLVIGTSVLTYTTSPIVLTDGIESLFRPLSKIGFPAHEIAMMMTIAIRFIPTIIDETDKIMECRCYRGGEGRTKLKAIKMKKIDAMAFLISALVFAGVITMNWL